MISSFLWEPLACLFYVSLAFGIWEKRKDLRNPFFWCVLLGLALALGWRIKTYIAASRYYGFSIVPALFCIFYFFRKMPWLQGKKKNILLVLLLLGCLWRCLFQFSTERSQLELYSDIKHDAENYKRCFLFSHTKFLNYETYYTGLTATHADYATTLEKQIENIQNNWDMWDGKWDAVYLSFEVNHGKTIPKEFENKDGLVKMGEVFRDRHKKKKITIFRYLPAQNETEAENVIGDLISNGDFSQLAKPKKQALEQLGRRADRFLHENPVFPENWSLYHSPAFNTKSFATVRTRENGNALYMDTDVYLAAISPSFTVEKSRRLGFSIHPESNCTLEVLFDFRSQVKKENNELYTIASFPLESGIEQRFSINLPQRREAGKGCVWFWLHEGTIDLSEVRLE